MTAVLIVLAATTAFFAVLALYYMVKFNNITFQAAHLRLCAQRVVQLAIRRAGGDKTVGLEAKTALQDLHRAVRDYDRETRRSGK